MLNIGRRNRQKIFLEGSEVILNGDEQCVKFLKTQAISEKLAKTSTDAIELIFENEKLIKKFNWQFGDRDELELLPEEKGLSYIPVVPHDFYMLQPTKTGYSHLGGEIPKGFHLPKFDTCPSFQFVGTLSPKTPGLDWLPFEFHLAVPIYGSFLALFMDYSDPLNPLVLEPQEYLGTDQVDEWVKCDTELIYEKVYLESKKLKGFPEIFEVNPGSLGVPNWIQNAAIPSCPKTGDTMLFVAQFGRGVDVKLKRSNIEIPKDGYYADLLSRMSFWADGDLYAFLNPNSKIACFTIQH
jgi:hypothetical protein